MATPPLRPLSPAARAFIIALATQAAQEEHARVIAQQKKDREAA